MLRDSFYKVISSEAKDDSTFVTTINIDKNHEIFKGHFPAIPIVPGVCMMQMVKELLQEKLGKKLDLKSAGNIKFLSVINPLENPNAAIEIKYSPLENSSYRADAAILVNNVPFFKIAKAIYR